MFERVKEFFGLATQMPEETGPLAGLCRAYEEGTLGDVPHLPDIMLSREARPDGYALGEQTPVPSELRLGR